MATQYGGSWDGRSNVTIGFGTKNQRTLNPDQYVEYESSQRNAANARLSKLNSGTSYGYSGTGGYGGYGVTGGGSSANASASAGGLGNTSLFSSAKELAQLQLDQSQKLGEQSYDFRNREAHRDKGFSVEEQDRQQGYRRSNADQDSSIRMREADADYTRTKDLEGFKQTHLRDMQDRQFNQERTMFNMQDAAKSRSVATDRQAAMALWKGKLY